MQLKVKRVDQTLPLPEYKTSGAIAFDLYARVETTVEPKTLKLIPLNLIIAIPEGYGLLLAARSSTPFKKNLMAANGVGIIDQDYSGPEDELQFASYNYTDQPVTVMRGDRIAQGIIIPIEKITFSEHEQLAQESRGGFGTTGK